VAAVGYLLIAIVGMMRVGGDQLAPPSTASPPIDGP
jgi:hypothetical protein